ncbi:MAG: hypothetical protein ABJZ55_11905 [Fuerstiella sp.]
MRGKWSFERAQKQSLKKLKNGMDLASEIARLEEEIADDPTPQTLACVADETIWRARANEACILATGRDKTQCLVRIHLAWRYSAFRWIAYLHRAEQLAIEFPRKARNRALPIGDIDFNDTSGMGMVMAQAAVLGEDAAHDWFGQRCLRMRRSEEPFVERDAWTVGPTASFLLWLYVRSLEKEPEGILFDMDFGPFQGIVDSWDDDRKLDDAVISLCDFHLKKVRSILSPDNDLVFGLAVGLGYFMPTEVLYLQRVREKRGLYVPKPAHEFLDQPMAQLPFPCPRSGCDPFLSRVYELCREAMPTFSIPWEQDDSGNTDWLEEVDLSTFRFLRK